MELFFHRLAVVIYELCLRHFKSKHVLAIKHLEQYFPLNFNSKN